MQIATVCEAVAAFDEPESLEGAISDLKSNALIGLALVSSRLYPPPIARAAVHGVSTIILGRRAKPSLAIPISGKAACSAQVLLRPSRVSPQQV
jgi:hypothetical protein